MCRVVAHPDVDVSLPVRGAWVEIRSVMVFFLLFLCRSPCGERGLKYGEYSYWFGEKVAPRAGSVG